MTTRTLTGSVLFVVVLAALAKSIGAEIADLRDWHGVFDTPHTLGVILERGGEVLLAALSGALWPQIGQSTETK